jgi:hypothetical protein
VLAFADQALGHKVLCRKVLVHMRKLLLPARKGVGTAFGKALQMRAGAVWMCWCCFRLQS